MRLNSIDSRSDRLRSARKDAISFLSGHASRGGLLLLTLGFLTACATSALPPLVPGAPVVLGPNQGLVIIDVDTDLPIERIDAGGGVAADNLAKGRHTWIVRVPAGRYRWKRVQFGAEAGRELIVRRIAFRDEEFAFDVVAGVLNYPGELVVRSNPGYRSLGNGLSIRNRNHSAMAVRDLLKSHPTILDRFPLHYAGDSRDGFLAHYSEERRNPDAEPPIAFAPVESSAPSMGLSAAALYSHDGVHRVAVSPDGEWAIAHGQKGRLHGVIVQHLGSTQLTMAVAAEDWLADLVWIGPDTFLVSFESRTGVQSMIGRLRLDAGEIVIDKSWTNAPGRLVEPLPLDGQHVVWEFVFRGASSVNKIGIEDLTEFRERHRHVSQGRFVGESLAKISSPSVSWVFDRKGRPQAAIRRNGDGYSLLASVGLGGGFREIYSFSDAQEEQLVWPLSLSIDGKQIIVLAYDGHDTRGLMEFDPVTKQLGRTLFRLDGVDVTSVVVDFITGELIAAVYFEGGEDRYHYFDSTTSRELDKLGGRLAKANVSVVSGSFDRKALVLEESDSTNPGEFHFFDVRSGGTARIGQRASRVDRESLVKTETLRIRSKDGTQVEAFLTLPDPSLYPRGVGVPLVIYPHGGPIGVQDSKQFDPLVQYLASWGFAALQVNYRGSGGYGRAFEEAGKREWGGAIEDDVDAAVEAAMARAEIDSTRLCIIGGSYGGFSSLASILRHPGRYRCAATINGVTDLPLMFESSDFSDSDHVLRLFADVVGDLEADRDRMIEVSPAYSVAEMRVPVFVAFGTEDRRVDADHAHRLLLLLENYGKDHQVLEIRGGRHSPTQRESVHFARALRRFLTENLYAPEEFVPDPALESAPFEILLEVKQ